MDKIEIAKWLPAWNGREVSSKGSEAYALLAQSERMTATNNVRFRGKADMPFCAANVCFQSGH